MLLSITSIIIILLSLLSYNYGLFKAAQAYTVTIPVRGDRPHGIAYNPANNNMYVANLGSSTVSVIDSSMDSVTSSILVGRGPQGIAYVSSNKLYVTNAGSGDVYVINGTINKVIKKIPVGNNPIGIAYNPSNNNIYIGNYVNGTVSVIDTSNDTVISTIVLGSPWEELYPNFLAYDSSNQGIYVTVFPASLYPAQYGQVSIINTATNADVKDSYLPTSVQNSTVKGVAYNTDNNRVYILAFYSGSVLILNPDTNTFEGTPIPVGSKPYDIVHNPSNNHMYVTNYGSNTVSAIDATRNSVVATFPTGDFPIGIAYNPNNRHIYVANTGSNSVCNPSIS
jgi:YVTN family beta-propeller protein